MIKKLKESGRFNLAVLLAAMSCFCFLLSTIRFIVSGTLTFSFLNWNLFLAFIPYAVSTALVLNKNYRDNKFKFAVLLFVWLLFFPNAPYILTDLFHLRLQSSVPVWFNLVLLLSFAWTGLVFGIISLLDIYSLLRGFLKKKIAGFIVVMLLFAGSFGIYLGRFMRWNSWDIISNPSDVIADIADRFINPMQHPRTWILTLLMGVLLNMIFWTIKLMTERSLSQHHK